MVSETLKFPKLVVVNVLLCNMFSELPEAETQCEQCLAEALKNGPNSPEPYQGMANLRLSQCRPEESIQMLEGVYERLAACTGYNVGTFISGILSGC